MARHTEAMERVASAILETPGDTEPALRRAAEGYAAAKGGRNAPAAALPAELLPYVDKVARHAYKVVDRDLDELREAGYSEDAIFELTLAAALGAAQARLERGLEAMR